jgi:hypothetical protein
MINISKLGKTQRASSFPWGLFSRQGTRVLCPDGKVRALAYLAQTPDTFFSTPAAVRIKGKYITGYMTVDEAYLAPDYATTRRAYTFHPHTCHHDSLPPFTGDKFSREFFEIMAVGEETHS